MQYLFSEVKDDKYFNSGAWPIMDFCRDIGHFFASYSCSMSKIGLGKLILEMAISHIFLSLIPQRETMYHCPVLSVPDQPAHRQPAGAGAAHRGCWVASGRSAWQSRPGWCRPADGGWLWRKRSCLSWWFPSIDYSWNDFIVTSQWWFLTLLTLGWFSSDRWQN